MSEGWHDPPAGAIYASMEAGRAKNEMMALITAMQTEFQAQMANLQRQIAELRAEINASK